MQTIKTDKQSNKQGESRHVQRIPVNKYSNKSRAYRQSIETRAPRDAAKAWQKHAKKLTNGSPNALFFRSWVVIKVSVRGIVRQQARAMLVSQALLLLSVLSAQQLRSAFAQKQRQNCSSEADGEGNMERTLRGHLFTETRYDKYIRPVLYHNQSVSVVIGISLLHIQGTNEKQQVNFPS